MDHGKKFLSRLASSFSGIIHLHQDILTNSTEKVYIFRHAWAYVKQAALGKQKLMQKILHVLGESLKSTQV